MSCHSIWQQTHKCVDNVIVYFLLPWLKKQHGMENICLVCWFWSQSILKGAPSWNLEIESETEAMKERCLLAFSAWVAHPAFISHQGTNSSTRLCPLILIIIKKMPCRHICRQSDGGIFLTWGSSFQITLDYVKLTET